MRAGLAFGSDTVQETQAPPGFVIDDTTARPVTIGAVGSCPSTGVVVEVPVFTDSAALGALRITKQTSGTPSEPLGGALFEVVGPSGPNSTTRTVNAGAGMACVDPLPFGSYTVTETQAPPGYVIHHTPARPVTVDAPRACPSTATVVVVPVFTDTPAMALRTRTESSGGECGWTRWGGVRDRGAERGGVDDADGDDGE